METMTDQDLRILNVALQTAQYHIMTCAENPEQVILPEIEAMLKRVKDEQRRRGIR